MQKLTTFISSLIKSSTDPDYYSDVLKAKFSFSLKYFFALVFFIAFIPTAMILLPIYKFDATKTANQFVSAFPQDLEATLSKDGLSINQERPYIIPMPSGSAEFFEDEGNALNYFMIFDTDENITSIKDFRDSKSFILLTETTAFIKEDLDTGEVRAFPLQFENMEDNFTISQTTVEDIVNKIMSFPAIKYKWYVPFLGTIIFSAIFVGYSIVKIISISINSIFVLIAKSIFLKNKTIKYKEVFQLSLHAITPFVLLELIIRNIDAIYIPGIISFGAFIAWMMLIISRLDTKTSEKTDKVSTKKTNKSKSK